MTRGLEAACHHSGLSPLAVDGSERALRPPAYSDHNTGYRPSMMPLDLARWTTTLTASYLAITAALIAILGQTVPGRVWLIAVHVTLAGALVILICARPLGGYPPGASRLASPAAVSVPLQGSGAAGGGDGRLAADERRFRPGNRALRRATEPVPQRAAGLRAAVRVPAFLLPVLRDRDSIGGRVLVRQRAADRLRRAAADALDRAAGATRSSSCCRSTACTTCRSAWARRSPATSSSISSIRCRPAAGRAAARFPVRTCRVRWS